MNRNKLIWSCLIGSIVALLIGSLVIFLYLSNVYEYYDYNLHMKIIASSIPVVASIPCYLGFFGLFFGKCNDYENNVTYVNWEWIKKYGLILIFFTMLFLALYSIIMGLIFDRNDVWNRFVFDSSHSGLFVMSASVITVLITMFINHFLLAKLIPKSFND